MRSGVVVGVYGGFTRDGLEQKNYFGLTRSTKDMYGTYQSLFMNAFFSDANQFN